MPTSATGISTDARLESAPVATPRCRPVRAGGFSLLELLVVVTIIGILAGAVVLSVGVVHNERDIEREVLRLRTLIDLVREESIMQSREYAILFAESSYRFYVYDYLQQRWVDPLDDALLSFHQLPEPLRLDLRVEDRDLVLELAVTPPENDDEEDAPQPQVMILSSGEMTAFEADFYRDLAGGRITLAGDLDGSFEITKEGFDDS